MSTDKSLKLILGEIREVKNEFKDFRKLQQQQSTEFHAIFKQLKEENSNLKNIVSDLQTQNNHLSSEVSRLSIGLNSLTQEKFTNNLLVAGIPFIEGENLPGLIIKAASALKVDIKENEFKAKRIFAKAKKGFSNIIVEFLDIELKHKLIKNKKQRALLPTQLGFKNTKEILFFHQLTLYNLDLLTEARQIKNKLKFKFAWFQNNQILLRKAEKTKIFAFRSKQELNCFLQDNVKEDTSEVIDLGTSGSE